MCLTFRIYIHSKYVYEYKNRKRERKRGTYQVNSEGNAPYLTKPAPAVEFSTESGMT